MDEKPKVIPLRRDDACHRCGAFLTKGTRAGWHPGPRLVECTPCIASAGTGDDTDAGADAAAPLDRGTPGGSLSRQYERRARSRSERVRARHPRLGGLILALTDEPSGTRAFRSGAEGERRVAGRLEETCGDVVELLHNRRLGRGRRDGDIDHVAIGPSGVFTLDAKRYPGAKVEVRRRGGLLTAREERLFVGGRDRTSMLAGVAKQVDAVRTALAGLELEQDVPVRGVLTFVDSTLPLLWDERVAGVPVLGVRATCRLVRRDGALDAVTRLRLAHHLAATLPPAA